MTDSIPFSPVWSFFCRRAIIDIQKKTVSAIDILPDITHSFKFTKDTEGQLASLSLGDISVVFCFRLEGQPRKLSVELNGLLSGGAFESDLTKVLVNFDGTDLYSTAIIEMPDLRLPILLEEGISTTEYKFSLRATESELIAESSLPVVTNQEMS